MEQFEKTQEFINCDCEYGIIGKEIAPTTGTPHLQCYFKLKTRMYKSTIYSRLGFRGFYLEIARGSDWKNVQYCRKNHNFVEAGSPETTEQKIERVNFYVTLMDDISFNEY